LPPTIGPLKANVIQTSISLTATRAQSRLSRREITRGVKAIKIFFNKEPGLLREGVLECACRKATNLEKIMTTVVHASKHLIPVERIALFEPFVMPAEPPFLSSKDFKGRVLLLDKMSVLTEETPEELAEANGFRFLSLDRVATNPAVPFSVETFTPAENFQPSKPYLSRLTWRDGDGNSQSKLLLASPEVVLAVAIRGEIEMANASPEQPSAISAAGKRAGRRRQRRQPAVAPA
jgi:hypothetical protein